MPHWADGKEDAYEALVALWLGNNEEFKAISERNKANRGHEGTHCAGARNHHRFKEKMVCTYMEQPTFFSVMFLPGMRNISLAMQESITGNQPLTDMETWEKMRMKRPDLSQPQPSLPEYFGTAKEDKDNYCTAFLDYNPEVDDPMRQETDVRALVVGGHGRENGRFRCLNQVTPRTPELSLTRIKATLTADGPAVPPPRRLPRARADVSFLNLIIFSTFVPVWLH